LVGGNEDELRILVNELLDEPWAGDAIDLHVFAGDPFHGMLLDARDEQARVATEQSLDGLAV
jgi:hypothetical protein